MSYTCERCRDTGRKWIAMEVGGRVVEDQTREPCDNHNPRKGEWCRADMRAVVELIERADGAELRDVERVIDVRRSAILAEKQRLDELARKAREDQVDAAREKGYDETQRVSMHGTTPDGVTKGAPAPIDPATGMHKDYFVLSDAERAKGFVRPVRTSYKHVGARPKNSRGLTDEELRRFDGCGYVAFESYDETGRSGAGRYWTKAQLESGCGTVTTMARALAETYARDPKFYGSTFCAACRAHFPVGAHGEFVWDGTDQRVGT